MWYGWVWIKSWCTSLFDLQCACVVSEWTRLNLYWSLYIIDDILYKHWNLQGNMTPKLKMWFPHTHIAPLRTFHRRNYDHLQLNVRKRVYVAHTEISFTERVLLTCVIPVTTNWPLPVPNNSSQWKKRFFKVHAERNEIRGWMTWRRHSSARTHTQTAAF